MWSMLQQPEPDNYVIATGTTTSVRAMRRIAFAHVGPKSEDHVVIDPSLYRPQKSIFFGVTHPRQRLVWGGGRKHRLSL
jgi:GDP-D-mannose dehydratase